VRRILLTLTALAAIAAPAGQTGESSTQSQLKHSTHVLNFFEKHKWLTAPRHDNCSTVPWQKSCRIAREKVRHHSVKAEKLTKLLWRTIPYTNDWRTSVKLAQRLYPGTEGWLLFISAREGGYGSFVMNHQGSGAGGWMQFMSGTFYGYVDAARADAERRGFNIPSNVWVWTHPLGQALTAGYMRYYGKDGCHWCL